MSNDVSESKSNVNSDYVYPKVEHTIDEIGERQSPNRRLIEMIEIDSLTNQIKKRKIVKPENNSRHGISLWRL